MHSNDIHVRIIIPAGIRGGDNYMIGNKPNFPGKGNLSDSRARAQAELRRERDKAVLDNVMDRDLKYTANAESGHSNVEFTKQDLKTRLFNFLVVLIVGGFVLTFIIVKVLYYINN